MRIRPRCPALTFLLALAACHPRGRTAAPDDGAQAPDSLRADSSDTAPRGIPSATTDAVFSAPIAAARIGDVVVVAGFVQSAHVIRAIGLRDGRAIWTADPIRDVDWTPNAELSIQAAGPGTALRWRSGKGPAIAGTLVILGPGGELLGLPLDARGPVCETSAGIAWVTPLQQHKAHVLARAWAESAPRELATFPADRLPTLACGDRTVFVLADGDEEVTVTQFDPGDSAAKMPEVAIRDSQFSDEERDRQAFTVGDTLTLLRVGERGTIAIRDIPKASAPGPWRTLKHRLAANDDIVAVDGNARNTVIAFTGDAEDKCPSAGSLAQRATALVLESPSGAESLAELSPADCARSPGSFWIGAGGNDAAFVAWAERKRQDDVKAAPISTVSYVRVNGAGERQAGKIDVITDALVQAGCDENHCVAAALVRPPGDDAMHPMAIRVFAYP